MQDGRADHDQAAAGKAKRSVPKAAVRLLVCLCAYFTCLCLWQGSSSPTNAKEEWWQQQLLAQQRESEERQGSRIASVVRFSSTLASLCLSIASCSVSSLCRTRTLRESTLVASLQSKSSATETKAKAATKASASESAEAPDQDFSSRFVRRAPGF